MARIKHVCFQMRLIQVKMSRHSALVQNTHFIRLNKKEKFTCVISTQMYADFQAHFKYLFHLK